MSTRQEIIAERRRRYEELKASGRAPTTLPGKSALPAASPDPAAVLHRETIPGGWYWSSALKAGEVLRLQTGDRPSCVSLFAWRAADPSERLNTVDTVKVQWTSSVTMGRVIFSDTGRVIFSVVEDSCACHDALVGGSTPASNARRFTGGPYRNTRDNFVLAAQKLGLGARDVGACISFFAPVRVDEDGRFHWHEERLTGGDYVDLRAEMDLLVALSNCPHPLDPSHTYAPAAIDVYRLRAKPATADDLCRTASDEARRGFENNAELAL